jgi:septum formation protein
MAGKSGVLHTGHALVHRGVVAEEVVSTTVTFSTLDPTEIVAYVATDEPIAVAGAFTLEGRSSAFIDRIDGDPGNVRGLSTAALRRLFASFGVPISALWV